MDVMKYKDIICKTIMELYNTDVVHANTAIAYSALDKMLRFDAELTQHISEYDLAERIWTDYSKM